jgi:glycerol-3-phosphate dehydrogenase (NAD(P)+)
VTAFAIVGAGAWGTALANAAALVGREVVLWTRDAQVARSIQESRRNEPHLPGVALHARVTVTSSAEAISGCGAVLLVVPAQAIRAAVTALPELPAGVAIVVCAKGIDRESGRFASDVVSELRPGAPVAVLSGPSFAADVARGLPTAVALAAADPELAARLAGELSGPTFRVYHGTDVRGVEIGGAAKNVLAIACGAVSGRGLGESARAALTARGFAELVRFAAAYGARPETLMGLSGLGDVVLSCASAQSRNFAFGERLGRGVPVADATDGKLVEGAFTASVLVRLARAKTVEMPIAEAVDAILAGRVAIDRAVEALMARPVKAER